MKPNDMTRTFHIFVKYVNIMRDYYNVRNTVSTALPLSLKNGNDREKAEKLGQWVNNFMTWDNSPALPRYDDVFKILDARRGRCGEYTNLYTACAIALGLETRIVLDFTDHVWTEVKIGNEWLAIDATFGNVIMDRFNRDNTKPLSYIIAFGPSKIEDVTKEYTKQWSEVEKRRTQTPFIETLIEMFNLGAAREDWL